MLRLPNDGPATGALLNDYLARRDGPAAIVAALADALPPLAERLAAGRLHGDPAAIVGVNDSGDKQKALDVGAHDYMLTALAGKGVRLVLSEEAEEIVELDPAGAWDIAIDPIDGSGSIGIGAPLGMLFAIFPAAPEGFLRTGRSVVAAGYASFGHSCDFGFSLGDGVTVATYDAEIAAFRVSQENVTIKPDTKSVAYNASNERHWSEGLKAWQEDMLAGKDGPRGKDFNMRWLGAAVGDIHRILLQGGVFLYPADKRKGYEKGRLRLLYETIPIAYIMEQAGGAATDGRTPILDLLPEAPHEHSPLICGSANEVALIGDYIASKG